VSVIALTVFLGLLLVTFFVVLYVRQAFGRSNPSRSALLPLEDDAP
jgi:cbb3-type cytochrome oxidase subunit 3